MKIRLEKGTPCCKIDTRHTIAPFEHNGVYDKLLYLIQHGGIYG
jgi:hypothetical protein